jgi:dephospho-CoA kinase
VLIGLTGGIGCGKSTVLAMFADLGCPVFSSDAEVASLLEREDVKDELRENFGLSVFRDGAVDKGALSGLVFGGPGPLKRLEAILHPRVMERLAAFAAAHPDEVAVAEVPLLFEKKLEGLFAATVCVSCSEDTGIRRYARARSVSEDEARRRAAWQMPLESKKQWAEFSIDTTGDVLEVRPRVEALHEQLKTLLKK